MKSNLSRPQLLTIALSLLCICLSTAVADDYTMRIACIGDSITQGRGTVPQTQSYRYPLWKMLIDYHAYFDMVGSLTTGFNGDPDWPDYLGIPFDRNHEGHWGWQTNAIRDSLPGWLAGYTPDIALVLLGTNDFGAGDTVAGVKEEMRQIIGILRADNPNVIIFIGKPFQEWDPFPALAAAYNDLAAEETLPNSPVIAVTHATGWVSNPDLPGTDTVDWVHPNAQGDAKLATNWFNAIQPYINSADDLINLEDLYGMAADWLLNDANDVLYAVDPCTAGLYGWWPCDEGTGDTAYNMVLDGNDGIIANGATGGLGATGSVWLEDPCRGPVLSFGGSDTAGAWVDCGRIPAVGIVADWTWSFWAKQDPAQTTLSDVIIGNHTGGTMSPLQYIKFASSKFFYYKGGFYGFDYDDIPADVWLHHCVVKDGYNFYYYRNGVLQQETLLGVGIDSNPFYIGGDKMGLRWRGCISDVRIYQRALSTEEVMYLADYPVHFVPIDSLYNFYNEEPPGSRAINFKDFAVMADYWLDFMTQ